MAKSKKPIDFNRAARRRLEKATKPTIELQKATVTLTLSSFPELRGGLRTSSFTTLGKSDFELWQNIMGESLSRMGYVRPDLVVGFISDMVNQLPENFRRALVRYIITGAGLQLLPEETLFCEACQAELIVTEEEQEFVHNDVPQKGDPTKFKACPDKAKTPESRRQIRSIMDRTYSSLAQQGEPSEEPDESAKPQIWTPTPA